MNISNMNPVNTPKQSIPIPEKEGKSLAEWVAFGVAAAILSTITGLVLYVWLGQQRQPPILSITYKKEIREVNGQFYIPFTLINQGGETVESVRVFAELEMNNRSKEQGEQEIDFLSGSEEREGAFIFSKNPRQGKLTLRVTSYKLP
jgi:uncharacterized protein (TIGR02588 family)